MLTTGRLKEVSFTNHYYYPTLRRVTVMLDGLQGQNFAPSEETLSQEAEGLPGSLQSHQLSPSQPVLQASTYMSGMEEKDRNHLSTLVDTAIIKVRKPAVRKQLYVKSQWSAKYLVR